MYTADHAWGQMTPSYDDLDLKIKAAVEEAQRWGASFAEMRVNIDDPWFHTIEEELEKRGFHGIEVPQMCLKGDVTFRW